MIRESIAIAAIGLLLLTAFMRSRHYGYMVASLPVLILPVAHLFTRGILYVARNQFFGLRPQVVMAFGDVLGLVAGCVVVGVVANKIVSKKARAVYLAVILPFTLLLGWIYIYSSLHVLLG